MRRIATATTAAVTGVVVASSVAVAAWLVAASGNGASKASSLSLPAGATATAQSSSVIRVSWTAPSAYPQLAASYVVRRVSLATPVCTIAQPETTTFCDDTGLTASTAYNYTIEATLGSWSSGQTGQFGTTTNAVPLTVSSLAFNNGSGGTAGRIDAKKDSITIGFSAAIRPQSVCSSFSNSATNNQTVGGSGGITVTLTDGGVSNDTLTVSAGSTVCGGTVNIGTFDLGSTLWTTTTLTYSGTSGANASTVQLNGTHTTLTISIGNGTDTPASPLTVGPVTATYSPSNAIKDDATNAVPASGTKSVTGTQF